MKSHENYKIIHGSFCGFFVAYTFPKDFKKQYYFVIFGKKTCTSKAIAPWKRKI